MRIRHYLKRAVSTPPHITLQKAWRKAREHWAKSRERERDIRFSTYNLVSNRKNWVLNPRILDLEKALSLVPAGAVLEKSGRILRHEFDLLGSGTVRIKYGMTCAGLEGNRFEPGPTVTADSEGRWLQGWVNDKNLVESRRIWGTIEQNYEPIDWQLDFKSGYRWKGDSQSRDIVYGQAVGADVKVPWELARTQHLAALAWAYGFAQKNGEGFDAPETYQKEFRNQILDFIALNPPRYGVNWACTMDVALRVANWLLAYDLFRSLGASFNAEFDTLLARSVHEHADHIFNHLEWDPHLRANHYLADIVGLFWAASHLVEDGQQSRWLSFANREFFKEVLSQFHLDGTNFEASTSYHRLSSEMVAYFTALHLGLGDDNWSSDDLKNYPEYFWTRLGGMSRFTIDITKPDGRVAQAGDNDSGRFFKLLPVEENSLDHRHLAAAFNGYLDWKALDGFSKGFEAETEVVRALAKGRQVSFHAASPPPTILSSYDSFGLYHFQKGPWWLCLRCGPVGQKGNGGHAHNDQLSFELSVEGVSMIVDPGTYLYTPLPEQRNLFRSTAMHNTMVIGGMEQNPWESGQAGLFQMKDRAKTKVIRFDQKTFIGEHEGFGVTVRRTLNLKEERLEGLDECDLPDQKSIYFHLAPGCQVQLYPPGEVEVNLGRVFVKLTSKDGRWEMENGFVSKAYGEKEPAPILVLKSTSKSVAWRIQNRTHS